MGCVQNRPQGAHFSYLLYLLVSSSVLGSPRTVHKVCSSPIQPLAHVCWGSPKQPTRQCPSAGVLLQSLGCLLGAGWLELVYFMSCLAAWGLLAHELNRHVAHRSICDMLCMRSVVMGLECKGKRLRHTFVACCGMKHMRSDPEVLRRYLRGTASTLPRSC